MKSNVWKPYVCTALTGWALTSIEIFLSNLFDSATQKKYLLCYQPIIHKVLGFKFSVLCNFLPFWGQWPVQWELSKKCAKRKYFNTDLRPKQWYVYNEGLRSWNFGISCLATIFDLSNWKITTQHTNILLQIWQSMHCFFMNLWLSDKGKSMELGNINTNPAGFWNSLPFHLALRQTVDWHASFYIAVCSIISLFPALSRISSVAI